MRKRHFRGTDAALQLTLTLMLVVLPAWPVPAARADDCNGNGIEDDIDIAEGTSEDCNGNGIPDDCDVDPADPDGNGEVSADCQPDGVPDECQLGADDYYVMDDGNAEYGLRSCGVQLAWLNQFTVRDNARVITALDVMYVNVDEGVPVTIGLWSDPDGDRDPTDAQLLASVNTVTENVSAGVFNRIDLPDTDVGGDGSSFFAGVIITYTSADQYPAPIDATAPSELGRSWIIATETALDPNDLSAGTCEFILLEHGIPFPANWNLRAHAIRLENDCNANGVPDQCDIAEGTSEDVDGNGVPDECEDCNGNGIPDGVDIAKGASLDCQPDGIPDECQLEGNDCNGDGIPDDCQLEDNDCNGNGVPDECDIDSGASQDLNGNGLPDECEDCNGNQIPDEWDISQGTSLDCQPDGIPDECQYGEPDWETYRHDDGTNEAILGIGSPAEVAWLNRFVVEPGGEWISWVDLAYSVDVPETTPVTVYLWSDPDGDGDPADAQVLASVETAVTGAGPNEFNAVFVGEVYVGEAGTSFFAGASVHDQLGYWHPITRDTDEPLAHQSWLAASSDPVPLDPNDLGSADFFGSLDSYFYPGNCLIRARGFSGVYPDDCNQNLVPDECDIAAGTSEDVDANGVPDECEDCNGNGIVDGCDVTCDGDCGTVFAGDCGLSADCNGNGIPDECELAESDCNGNGIPDDCDIAEGTSLDCNLNGIPDECDIAGGTSEDCNDNGVPDECDVSSGTSLDCNGNGIPDECDVRDLDCNGNGVPDDCDIAEGTSPDCDGNGVPDECDIAGGALDCNLDGIPDECQPEGDCDGNGLLDVCEPDYDNGLVAQYWTSPQDGVFEERVLVRVDPAVDFNWGGGGPVPGLDDRFAGRWTGLLCPPQGISGTYLFHVTADDGVRLWVGNQLLVDEWHDSSSTEYNAALCLAGGYHVPIRVEYYEDGGSAEVRLRWTVPGGVKEVVPTEFLLPMQDCNGNLVPDPCDLAEGTSEDCTGNGVPDECEFDSDGNGVADSCDIAFGGAADCNGNGMLDAYEAALGVSEDCDGDGVPDECQQCRDCDGNGMLEACEAVYDSGLVAQYWASEDGDGSFSRLARVQVDPNIDFDWGGGAPGVPGIDSDHFAVRWSGTVTTTSVAGTYTFYVLADDGVRLWVDGQLLVDEWHGASGNEYSATIALGAGQRCLVAVEYYESGGDARVVFSWRPPMGAKEVVPAAALNPISDTDGDGYPDICDEDCNGNGVADVADIGEGTSADCNENCVPDECDVTVPPFDPGLAYWRFEEASGAVADSGPNGLDGTITGSAYRNSDVPVDPVPQSGSANTQSLDLNYGGPEGSGHFTVADGGGLLSMGDYDFTIEAWVRLDELSNTGAPDQRQYFCQKKPLPTGDAQLDFAVLVQRGDSSPYPNYGKTGGFTGRELQMVFGTGSSIWGVTSHLQIDATGWHYVAVTHNASANRVSFVLDDQEETVEYNPNPRITNSGPLAVGAHQNASGVWGMYLRGAVDELRVSGAVLSVNRRLSALPSSHSEDHNGNGIPDECESQTGTVGASLNCVPAAGTVPFSTVFTVALDNLYAGQVRRVAARINVTLASGGWFPNWRAGYANIATGSSVVRNWTQNIPALGSVIGENSFTLVAEDVTPTPYNQPPYPSSGDTATAVCAIVGIAP